MKKRKQIARLEAHVDQLIKAHYRTMERWIAGEEPSAWDKQLYKHKIQGEQEAIAAGRSNDVWWLERKQFP